MSYEGICSSGLQNATLGSQSDMTKPFLIFQPENGVPLIAPLDPKLCTKRVREPRCDNHEDQFALTISTNGNMGFRPIRESPVAIIPAPGSNTGMDAGVSLYILDSGGANIGISGFSTPVANPWRCDFLTYYIKRVGNPGGSVTFTPNAGQTIEGGAAPSISIPMSASAPGTGGGVHLAFQQSTNTWFVLASHA